jgi:hypothetical protein
VTASKPKGSVDELSWTRSVTIRLIPLTRPIAGSASVPVNEGVQTAPYLPIGVDLVGVLPPSGGRLTTAPIGIASVRRWVSRDGPRMLNAR